MAKSTNEHQHEGSEHAHGIFGERAELFFAIGSGAILTTGYLTERFGAVDAKVVLALSILAYFFGGFFASLEAFKNIIRRRFEIDSLMIVAAVGAASLGKWAEGALLLALFSLGHALEHYAMGRAKKAIEALADLAPKLAHVLHSGTAVDTPIEDVKVGDTVVVKPNERIPVDGYVIKGTSSVNQAPITGESIPVDKSAVAEPIADGQKIVSKAEHAVFAGSINGAGALEIFVTKKSTDSTLARVAKLVAEAQTDASPTQLLTKKFEKYFVPTVLVSVLFLLLAFLVIDENFSVSFYRAMAVLVAASPCALAISTPSAVLSGIARAGRAGILIKGGAALENLGNVTVIAFDKTGTLTEGKPVLTDVAPLNGVTELALLRVAVAVEAKSDHPLAQAIVLGGEKRMGAQPVPDAGNVKGITGRGVEATVDGERVVIGKPVLFEEIGGTRMTEEMKSICSRLESSGRTTMVVRAGQVYLGALGVMDTPRKNAKDAVARLRKVGIQRTVMISGDNQIVANSVAKEVGIDEAIGNLMPEDKVATIKKLRLESGKIAMVGDGVNDAPALASVDVGIAMGAAGSDVALETADVALMTDNLDHLAFAVNLSRHARRIIRQNLWVSLGVVACLVPATIFGLGIGPAIAMHEGSTLVVVLNALRLLAFNPKEFAQ